MKKVYKDLMTIKRPVWLIVKSTMAGYARYRVIFPDGSIIYNHADLTANYKFDENERSFVRSCFNYKYRNHDINKKRIPSFKSLEEAILQMSIYDKHNGMKITKVIKL